MFTEYRKIHIVVIAKLGINIYIYIQTAMLGTREYTLCSPFRANAHNSSYYCNLFMLNHGECLHISFCASYILRFNIHCIFIFMNCNTCTLYVNVGIQLVNKLNTYRRSSPEVHHCRSDSQDAHHTIYPDPYIC